MKARNLIYQLIARRNSECKGKLTTPLVKGQFNVIMMCHGESEWDKKHLISGWYDTKLSLRGRREALEAGKILKNTCFKFDMAFTSVLSRAHETLDIVLKYLNIPNVPIVRTWCLNERHFGALTGLDKREVTAQYGENQLTTWCRSYCIPPPPMKEIHRYYTDIVFNPVYKSTFERFPKFESIELTAERTLPFWCKNIAPHIFEGKKILIVGHESSLKCIIKYLDKITDKDIGKLDLPTGIPFLYALQCKDEQLTPVPYGSLQFLADPRVVKHIIEIAQSLEKEKAK